VLAGLTVGIAVAVKNAQRASEDATPSAEEEKRIQCAELMLQATEAYKAGEFRKTLALCDQMLEIEPTFAMAYLKRALAHAELENEFRADEDCLSASTHGDPRSSRWQARLDLDPKTALSVIYASVGHRHAKKGDHAGAWMWYRSAVRCDPNHPAGHAGLASSHAIFREWKEGVAEIDKAIELGLDLNTGHKVKALILLARARARFVDLQKTDAKIDFEAAVKLDPTLEKERENFGW
jgi:tetratricopeptide (TPR) repeat protein